MKRFIRSKKRSQTQKFQLVLGYSLKIYLKVKMVFIENLLESKNNQFLWILSQQKYTGCPKKLTKLIRRRSARKYDKITN